MKSSAISVTYAYVALVLIAVFGSILLPFKDGARVPDIVLQRDSSRTLNGLIEGGLWRLDESALHSSVNRLAVVRVGRQMGNSMRVAVGQRVEWIVWGNTGLPMLFPTIDLWVSRGLNPEVESQLERAASTIAHYSSELASEGWTLVVVPVPTKMAVHYERVSWPVQGESLTTRDPIASDRSGEVYELLQQRLVALDVAVVNLQELYWSHLMADPQLPIYASNDSHWAGEGIRMAAEATAQTIATESALVSRVPINPTYLEVSHVGDLAKAFDPMPGFTTWLSPLWSFNDRLMNGEAGRGYVYAEKPVGLVVVVGTSYSGQYTWIENQPVGFTWQLGLHLEDVEIQNRPVAGRGSFYAFHEFWRQRKTIEAEFISKHGRDLPRILVWEFPVRDVGGIAESGN